MAKGDVNFNFDLSQLGEDVREGEVHGRHPAKLRCAMSKLMPIPIEVEYT